MDVDSGDGLGSSLAKDESSADLPAPDSQYPTLSLPNIDTEIMKQSDSTCASTHTQQTTSEREETSINKEQPPSSSIDQVPF